MEKDRVGLSVCLFVGPLFLVVHWPPGCKDKGSRGGMWGFVGLAEIAFRESVSVLQLSFIPEGNISMGASPVTSPHLCSTAGYYQTAGGTKPNYLTVQQEESLQEYVSKVTLETGQASGFGDNL